MNDLETEVHIRLIRQEDNPRVEAIIKEVMPEFSCSGPGYAINDPEVEQMFETYSKDRSKYFVIEQQGHILGGAGYGPLKGGAEEVCELRKMYFVSSARGKGLGRKLLELILVEAKRDNYELCYLETVEQMNAAQSLYSKLGFEPLRKPMGETGHFSCDRFYSRPL